jgi:hypothetical protein
MALLMKVEMTDMPTADPDAVRRVIELADRQMRAALWEASVQARVNEHESIQRALRDPRTTPEELLVLRTLLAMEALMREGPGQRAAPMWIRIRNGLDRMLCMEAEATATIVLRLFSRDWLQLGVSLDGWLTASARHAS